MIFFLDNRVAPLVRKGHGAYFKFVLKFFIFHVFSAIILDFYLKI